MREGRFHRRTRLIDFFGQGAVLQFVELLLLVIEFRDGGIEFRGNRLIEQFRERIAILHAIADVDEDLVDATPDGASHDRLFERSGRADERLTVGDLLTNDLGDGDRRRSVSLAETGFRRNGAGREDRDPQRGAGDPTEKSSFSHHVTAFSRSDAVEGATSREFSVVGDRSISPAPFFDSFGEVATWDASERLNCILRNRRFNSFASSSVIPSVARARTRRADATTFSQIASAAGATESSFCDDRPSNRR